MHRTKILHLPIMSCASLGKNLMCLINFEKKIIAALNKVVFIYYKNHIKQITLVFLIY